MGIEFEIKGEYIELIKLLKAAGLCDSGGQAKIVVSDGLVIVDGDGDVELRKKRKIRKGQVVEFEGQEIRTI